MLLDRFSDVARDVDRLDPARDLVDDELHREREELRLGRKDVSKRSFRDAGLGSDLANGGRFDAVAQHDTPERFPELPTTQLVVDLANATL